MFWSLVVTLAILWLLGLITGIGGQLIHGLLVLIGLVLFVRWTHGGRVE